MRRSAKVEARNEATIDMAFDRYMDEQVARLVALGLDDVQALETLFEVADYCSTEGLLPEFPDDRATFEDKGIWLVRASDFDFGGFLLQALTTGDDDGV